jgi:hypothetical protein
MEEEVYTQETLEPGQVGKGAQGHRENTKGDWEAERGEEEREHWPFPRKEWAMQGRYAEGV